MNKDVIKSVENVTETEDEIKHLILTPNLHWNIIFTLDIYNGFAVHAWNVIKNIITGSGH